MPEEVKRKLDRLTEVAEELTQEIDTLQSATGQQNNTVLRRLTRNKRVMILVLISFLVDIGVTIGLAVTINHTANTTDKVNNITARLNYGQDVQRRKVLCPLYQIFVDSKSEAARKTYPKGVKEYDRVFGIIQRSYNVLECNKPIPAVPKPPGVK